MIDVTQVVCWWTKDKRQRHKQSQPKEARENHKCVQTSLLEYALNQVLNLMQFTMEVKFKVQDSQLQF